MGHSIAYLNYHIVFANKKRFVTPVPASLDLKKYLNNLIKNGKVSVAGFGLVSEGKFDHIHLCLHTWITNEPICKQINIIKTNLSKTLEFLLGSDNFVGFQNGYYIESIGFHSIEHVKKYIENQ